MRFLIVKAKRGNGSRSRALVWLVLLWASLSRGDAGAAGGSPARFWEVATLSGSALQCLIGAPEAHVTLVACTTTCRPIRWQLDERNADGEVLLDHGVLAAMEKPPGVIDADDEILWMAADGGRPMRAHEMPADALCGLELQVTPAAGAGARVYAFVVPSAAPRAAGSYVEYDALEDTFIGPRLALGFRGATPRYLRVKSSDKDAVNLLDRLKVRASAWFLGLIPMGRDEDDLEPAEVGWRAGPIRIVRRQRQRIRLGWGIRSPRFNIETYFYRDVIRLPVHFRLNFPPTYFFGRIVVQALLDFRDLHEWRVWVPELAHPLPIADLPPGTAARLSSLAAQPIAISGPDVQLMQLLETSPSLAPLTRRLLYRQTTDSLAPEAERGEHPGIGYALVDWGGVGNGWHWFAALDYVLPADFDLTVLLRERREPTLVHAVPFAPER
jgi:hypothetical protein